MRKTFCASVLVVALCGSTFAGDIGTPPIAPGDIPNPPSATQMSGEQTIDGWIGTGAPSPTADGLTDAALTVLNSVLALL